MAVNKVEYGDQTLIDLTTDSVTEDAVLDGVTFHGADGEARTGAFTLVDEMTEQDALIEQIKTALKGKAAGGGSGLPTQEKTVEITENGTVEVLPDEGYALSKVTANVAVPIPDGYIKPGGTLEVTENGTHDVAEYASVNVNIPTGGGDDTDTNTTAMANLLLGKITELYNDKAVGTLAPYMFYEQNALTRVELPNIQYLKERCFYSCSALETLLLPGLVGYTYQYMAAYCPKLVTVDIHNSNYISSYSFRDCSSLARLDLHKATNIGTYAFYGCTKLETLILRMDAVPTLGGTNAFTNTKIAGGTGYIYVPSALIDSYKTATNWSTYADQFRAIEDYPDICG